MTLSSPATWAATTLLLLGLCVPAAADPPARARVDSQIGEAPIETAENAVEGNSKDNAKDGEKKADAKNGDAKTDEKAAGKCPVMNDDEDYVADGGPGSINRRTVSSDSDNAGWWPNRLPLEILRANSPQATPFGADFDYAKEFLTLDIEEVKRDVVDVMTTSQDWWPADYGNYGPFFIRMAWHSAGTYRVADGRGGADGGPQRFAPLGSWPDNANLDKARRLLWPVKEKYGRKLSWADLMILAGHCAIENMGVETVGFAGGRIDEFTPENGIFWGPESEWLASERYDEGRSLQGPLAASQMGLIYVNPQGPDGKPDPIAAAADIRETFGRMAMNDEETVALIAGGHTFGKAHGATNPDEHVGPVPEAAPLENLGMGWINSYGKGNAEDTITSGLEGAWTSTPTEWSNQYFENLFGYTWELDKGPGGGWQWYPTDEEAEGTVPDAHVEGKTHKPMMFTTDIALKEDPAYEKVSRRFLENPGEFEKAFANAWYKLTHRDMGPVDCLLGKLVAPARIWQDPVPKVDHELVDAADVDALKKQLLATGLSPATLVETAWASASTYRASDRRGGANGARIRLAPQKDWAVNNPDKLASTLAKLEQVQADFNGKQDGGKKVSLADLIVLAGAAGVEEAARQAGTTVNVPFTPGRTDATAEQTDAESFEPLQPKADGFRNYLDHDLAKEIMSKDYLMSPEMRLIDRAALLGLTAPEMTALVGGLRVIGVGADSTKMGVLTERPGQLTNDFFVNLIDMDTRWAPSERCSHYYEGSDRVSGDAKWNASSVDLIFGSNAELRAIAEVYAASDGAERFTRDFVSAWTKVMMADRFDLEAAERAQAAIAKQSEVAAAK